MNCYKHSVLEENGMFFCINKENCDFFDGTVFVLESNGVCN